MKCPPLALSGRLPYSMDVRFGVESGYGAETPNFLVIGVGCALGVCAHIRHCVTYRRTVEPP